MPSFLPSNKTHRFSTLYGCLFLIISLLCSNHSLAESLPTTISGEPFYLELAYTQQQRSTGLMHRKIIAENGGMLFIYSDTNVRWYLMKNCLVDIDLIYLDESGIIVALHQMIVEHPAAFDESDTDYTRRLKHYSSKVPAQYVIELKAGQIQTLKLAVGDTIPLAFSRLKKYQN